MTLSTNLSASPYFDDFDPTKNFHQILFKPRIPVQARELNQIQTILQNQIERFGDQIFKDGSVVYGCSPQVNPGIPFVRLQDLFNININRNINDLNSNCLIVGNTSNVRAIPIIIKEGRISQYPDTNRFYVRYLNTGVGGQTQFQPGETISIYNSSQNALGVIDANNLIDTIQVLSSNSSVSALGAGYAMTINEGMLYQKGYFQRVDKQIGLVRDFDQNTYNMVVGFDTKETLITSDSDESLLDNALGYPNYNAPGADRLKLTPTLIAKDKTLLANNDSFFTVYEFSNVTGALVQVQNAPAYDELGDALATRTYEESGDYVIKPFLVETLVDTSNNNQFFYQVDPGIGYVHGKRVEFLSSKKIMAARGSSTKEAIQQLITTNYGNYIYVKEVVGSFDFDESVDLYDTPQLAITNRRWQTVPLGNKIGTAKVRTIIHEDGIKGTNSANFLLYIYNIQMNPGYSFSNNVKSFYSNNNGIAVADSVLINGQSVLQESNNNKLIFSLGKKAVKTLRSANGTINRTQFSTRLTSNATLQANGFIQVTLASPPAGGINSIAYSNGIVGDLLETDFNVVLTSNVSTIQLPGTININSGSTTITGTGTNFTGVFSNNEFISITSGGTTDYRRIISVNSGTSIVLDAAPSVSNASAVYSKFYPGGYIVPLNNTLIGTRTINVTSSTTFEINTGLAASANLTGNQTVLVSYKVNRAQATAKKKNILRDQYIKLHANTISGGMLNLGMTDVFKIKGVWAGSSFAETNSDVTSYFGLNSGMTDDIYDHSKLILSPKYSNAFVNNEQLLVKVDRFVANTSGGLGFFSVDSYPVDDVNTANVNAIQTSSIPVYYSSTGTYDLKDSIDFRKFKIDTAVNSSTIAGATLNPATTSTFVTDNAYIPEPDSNFETDLTFYLGRIDLINMNATGGLTVIQGAPSETPRTPLVDKDSMTIASAIVPPYPSLTSRELEVIPRKDYAISTTVATNRNYTMKDIGVLDQRIERLEYYVTLNQLEQQAKDIQVPDSNGLNRFKNGIFADPLNSHAFGDTTNFEYNVSIDSDKGVARPLFRTENIDLRFDANTSTVQKTENILTLPYTHEQIISQPFATKYRNCTEDFWNWSGMADLYPGYDMARDETRLPNVDASIDLTQPFMDFASTVQQATGATIFGTRYGDWRTTSQSLIYDNTYSTDVGNFTTNTYRDTVTSVTQQRTISTSFTVPVSRTIDLGSSLVDISVQPYMKSREIGFALRSMKPNTRIYVFFDSNPYSQYCAPGIKVSNDITTDRSIVRTNDWGTPLYTDANGNLIGKVYVPAGNIRVGDRTLLFVNVDNLIVGADAILTKASSVFTSSNIATSSRNTTLTTTVPSMQTTTAVESQSYNVGSNTLINSSYNPPLPPSPPTPMPTSWDWPIQIQQTVDNSGNGGGGGGSGGGGGDPIAQTYSITSPQMQSGVFATQINLYFKSKDPNLGITLVIVPCEVGIPNTDNIIAMKHLNASEVNVSDDSSVKTTFNFNLPYHNSSTQYAFVIMPDSNNPNYEIWMAELGKMDVMTGSQVFACPYSGAALKSSNAKTWTTLPKEQVKFDISVANFSTTTGTASFYNDYDDYITYKNLSLTNPNNPLKIGDECYPVSNTNAITNTAAYSRIETFDTTNARMKLDASTGVYTANTKLGIFRFTQSGNTAQANTSTLVGTFSIDSILNPPIHAIVPKLSTIIPLNSSITTDFRCVSNTASLEAGFNQVVMDTEKEYMDFERVIFSKSNETIQGIQYSGNLRALLATSNRYISPIIDLSNKSIIAVENIVNNDATNENTRYGNALNKYICKPITLAAGQDAEDLLVYISAWRPVNTDFLVYCKLLNGEDYDDFYTKEWSLMTNQSREMYSSSLDPKDYREWQFKLPNTPSTAQSAYRNPSNNNVIRYSNTTNAVYDGFKVFAIKVVILSNQRNIPPILDNLRCIACQN